MRAVLGKLNPNRLVDRWAHRAVTQQKTLVERGPEAARGLLLRGALMFLVGLTSLVGANWLPEPYDTFAWMVLGWMVGTSFLGQLRRATAYRNGWLDGRLKMLQGIQHSSGPEEWVKHQYEYDMVHVLGLPIGEVPDSPEGLE